ncbi:MAG: MATE family efflux transporter, partial [Lachnoanaerobaculum saburreum]
ERIYHILSGGMPNFLRQSITSIALILLNITAAKYGDSLLAALTVSSRISALAYMIMIGWSQGFQPICAMNYGAKKYTRVQEAFKLTAIIGSIFLVFSAILLYVFSAELVKTMTSDIEVISISVWILRMQCITMPFVSFFAVSSMLLQNIGKYLMASILSVSRQGIFFILLLYILSCLFSQYGIYLLQPFSDILSFALAVFMVRSVWKSFIKII